MIMASHHKTGTSVIRLLASTLAHSFPSRIAQVDRSDAGKHNHWWPNSTAVRRALSLKNSADAIAVLINPHARAWPPADYPQVRCLVHLTRNPVDLVVSAYLYHLRLGTSQSRCNGGRILCEAWLYEPTQSCTSLLGVSHFDKLHLAPNETAGLLCQLERSTNAIREMQNMERDMSRRPGMGMTMNLDEWHDSNASVHKVCAFCGIADLAERALREYRKAYAQLSTSAHVNQDEDRAMRLRAYLHQVGVA